MEKLAVLLLAVLVCSAYCAPVDSDIEVPSSAHNEEDPSAANTEKAQDHNIRRRFINQMFNLSSTGSGDINKLRTKRSEEECEKLHLCKLHARSRLSFFAAYELYFVNKENARLWDHHARTLADCEQRYGDCYNK